MINPLKLRSARSNPLIIEAESEAGRSPGSSPEMLMCPTIMLSTFGEIPEHCEFMFFHRLARAFDLGKLVMGQATGRVTGEMLSAAQIPRRAGPR
jgi:hypothetical protein